MLTVVRTVVASAVGTLIAGSASAMPFGDMPLMPQIETRNLATSESGVISAPVPRPRPVFSAVRQQAAPRTPVIIRADLPRRRVAAVHAAPPVVRSLNISFGYGFF